MDLFGFFRKREAVEPIFFVNSRKALPGIADFIDQALSYRTRLDGAKNFDEIYKIWKSFSFEYSYSKKDPTSPAYKDEVLDLYKRLTNENYDIGNESSSDKQSKEDFEVGYPYNSKNLEVINNELAKTMQGIASISSHELKIQKIAEFGSGWGNLALPLAKAGRDVTAIDIDRSFLERLGRLALRDNVAITCVNSDFIGASGETTEKYDAVLFQASFHHCLDFDRLIDRIRDNMLQDDGVILFLCEPIFKNYPFPWGIRYDGESVWAVMANKWLELGFDEDFFIFLLLTKGFFPQIIPPIEPYIGQGWKAVSGSRSVDFRDVRLPEAYDQTFYPVEQGGEPGRFCKEMSRLPLLQNDARHVYDLELQNYDRDDAAIKIVSAQSVVREVLRPAEIKHLRIDARQGDVLLYSDTFNPSKKNGTADIRDLGLKLLSIFLVH